jgi:alpha-amylase/alpha-mannosidase (GH57 family)
MATTHLMLLWHMHQPYYKDLADNIYAMPWTRLHALKDYFGMVAILRDFPDVHVTFNLVPSLVAQILDYARGTAREPEYEIAFKPAHELTPRDRESLLKFAFQLNWENLLFRHPRFRDLFEKAQSLREQPEPARLFSVQELLDLQVLSQLAWFDEIFLADDAEVRRLAEKGRGYSEEDKALVRRKEMELLKVALEEYRKASERGQVEVSTSPFYHPILPLVCDTDSAAESRPGIRLPRRRFRHPEDARAQLRRAVELHTEVFGSRPRGLWPSEGSVSDEALRIAAEEGFQWAATDEGVLARSLGVGFHRQVDGTVSNGQELYRPHRFSTEGRSIALFFRDHQISDLIGFVYSRMDAHSAAHDLYRRILAAGASTGAQPAVVSIILDGENAWEYFPGNGREFLKTFYGLIASDPRVKAVTASEALTVTAPGELPHVVPGSWINSNFDVWIGHEEDNRAWDLLSEARDFLAEEEAKTQADDEKLKLAREELYIAEGSDWCWWYGPEHSSAHDEEFDRLFRKHLSNIYRLLGAPAPDELAVPIKRPRVRAVIVPPTGPIEARVDGRVTNYFEWLGAGVYSPDYRSSAMHGGEQAVEALYFGHNSNALYLRLDLNPAFLQARDQFEVRVSVDGEGRGRIAATIREGNLGLVQFWRGEEPLLVPLATGEDVQAAFFRVFELKLAYSLLGLAPGEKTQVQVSLWADELPLQVIPPEGWLTVELTDEVVSW